MKVWIGRDWDGLTAFLVEPERYYLNPFDEEDFIFVNPSPNPELSIPLETESFPEIPVYGLITIEIDSLDELED